MFMKKENNLNLLCGFLIHTCDFSGSTKKFEVSTEWA